MKTINKASCVVALSLLTPLTANAIVVDGINTAGEYSIDNTYGFSFMDEQDNSVTYEGFLSLAYDQASDGSGQNNIFVLLQVPTSVTDLTFGDNLAPGWDGHDKYDDLSGDKGYKKVTGSESWKFLLNDEEVKLKMKDDDNDGVGAGYVLDKDGDGAIVSASTSLDYNINLYPGAFGEGTSSPFCGNAPTTDAECYENVEAAYADYVFAHQYEIEIDGSLFNTINGSNLLNIVDYITESEVHASPSKYNSNVFIPVCLENPQSCNPVEPPVTPPPPPPVTVAEPAIFGFLAFPVIMGFLRRRKLARTVA